MPTFVLVHPAWFGGWCWNKVVPQLRSAGQAVYAPTLTGLGERAHLAHPGVSLSLHIEDVVNMLEFEDLNAVTLVGSSSGGSVITGVVDRVPDRVERVVYLDAFLPSDGQSTGELVPPNRWAAMKQLVESEGYGWLLPRFSPAPWEPFAREAWEVSEEDLSWVLSRLRPTPVRHFTEPMQLRHSDVGGPTTHRVYIRCRSNPSPQFDRWAAAAQSSPEWTYRELMLPHLPYITHPDETTEVLLDVTA